MLEKVEYSIKKIINIDRDVESYKLQMEGKLTSKKSQLEETILQLNKQHDELINIKKREILEDRLHKANMDIQCIKSENSTEIIKLYENFNLSKDEIVSEIFRSIISLE